LIAAHIRPDGDAIGSLLGLGNALRQAGKTVLMVLSDGIPPNFHYLPGAKLVKKSIPLDEQFDITISLDTSDLDRTGGIFGDREIGLNIDHHITNTYYGISNYNDPEAVATCAILASKLQDWGLEINQETAALLLTGIITDSIGFRTSNMTSEAMRITADLMDKGANLPEIYQQALVTKSFEQVVYWGHALKQLHKVKNLAWTTFLLEDRKEAGYNGNDDADLNSILSSIQEISVSILFVEQSNGSVKVSWRAKPGINISTLAQELGGGGHPAAAGVEMKGMLVDIQNIVIEKTLNLLDGLN
ncbi:MAG TPA: DHH family phosphoesterase, partial [Anaerolineaceae bacterium]|nr:DHH family phosphoesterase [Anaerolineaceae bacterium]